MRVDVNGMMRNVVGAAGVTDDDFSAVGTSLDEAGVAFQRARRSGLAALPYAKTELRRTLRLAESVRGSFDHLVVLASDDLRLGVQASTTALAPRGPEDAAAEPATAPQIHILDHLDPEPFADLLARLDLRRTLFNVMSGPGDALETIGPFLIVRERLLRELGAVAYKQHVMVTTRGDGGPLRQIVNDEGFRDLTLPNDVPEAHALLTAAALFPAACMGADVGEVLAGAADMDERCRAEDVDASPARRLAASDEEGRGQGGRPRVLPPGVHALRSLARWIERVVAAPAPEAEGVEAAAEPASTAVRPSSPPTLFVRVERRPLELDLPKAYQDLDGVGYLGGQGLGALADRREEAMELELWDAGVPTMTLRCPENGPAVFGQITYLVAAAATLVGSAAGMERPVRLAYGLTGRPGYESERAEAQRAVARREARYVV